MRDLNSLKFPSGRPVSRAKQDAKQVARQQNIPLHQALDLIAGRNGFSLGWHNAISQLAGQHAGTGETAPHTFKLYPHRKLLVHALNQLLEKGLLSLDWDEENRTPSSHLKTTIEGESAIVTWSDAGFGEVRISVWWKYDHSKHPQASLEPPFKEEFSTSQPMAKRHHFKEFVGVVCSAWLERDTAKHLQGYGEHDIFDKYTRRGELEVLKSMPDPIPSGFEPEGQFFM